MDRKKIGINCEPIAVRYGDIKALEICAEAGFDAVDFGLTHFCVGKNEVYNGFDEELINYFEKIKKRADELGLIISQTHGRTATYRPDDEAHNLQVLENTRRDLLATAALGAPACVIHSITTGRWLGADAETMHKKNKEMFEDFIPTAEALGVNIALETFGDSRPGGVRQLDFFGDVRELKKQYGMLETKNKILCMDTGHTHKAHNVDPTVPDTADAIRYLGIDIKLLHLNDNNGYSDQHLPPLFAGDSYQLDWKDIMAVLDEIGYSGVYSFELNLSRFGSMLDETTRFLEKYLRKFVDGEL